MDVNNKNFRDQEKRAPKEEEEEDAISLSNFPLNYDEVVEKKNSFGDQITRRSSSEPSDFFEFFNDLNSYDRYYMSHAEDIIFGGKLVPYQKQVPPLFNRQSLKFSDVNISTRSLPDLNHNRSISSSNSNATRFTRSSRSLDSKKPRRNSRHVINSDFRANFPKNKSELSKPRWYVLMFGLVKLPPGMDLQDIKNRQIRRNPVTLFPEKDDRERVPTRRRRSSWGHDLIRVLSCKSHASVAVSTSIGGGIMNTG